MSINTTCHVSGWPRPPTNAAWLPLSSAPLHALLTGLGVVYLVIIIIIIITIIQLYFRPQWVHKKDNTKYAEHVNITQITKYALNMSAYHSSLRLYKVAIHLLFSFDATCTSLLITLCVIKLKETSSLQRRLYFLYRSSDSCLTTIDIRGCKHGTCTGPHRQTTQDTKRIIIRYNKLAHASLSIGDP